MSKKLRAALYTILTLISIILIVLLCFKYPMAFGLGLLIASIIVFIVTVYKLFCLHLKD
jgi:hypothetical protein